MNVNLKPESLTIVPIELMIQTLAVAQANGAMMIELLAKSEAEADERFKEYNEDIQDRIESILEDLYVRHGKLEM